MYLYFHEKILEIYKKMLMSLQAGIVVLMFFIFFCIFYIFIGVLVSYKLFYIKFKNVNNGYIFHCVTVS